jgi:hypothetical protein
MPDTRERELIEPTSSRKTGHQMREKGGIPQSQLWPIIVPVWKNYRDGNREDPEEKKVQQQAQSGIQLKGRSQGLTLLLRLWNAHKKGPSMKVLRKTQQAAERVRCRYLHPTNAQKRLLPVVELGKSWKKLRRRGPCRKTSSLNNSWPLRSLKHCITKPAAYTSWYEASNTQTVENQQVCVHSKMMHLTLKRLEAPGCLEIRGLGRRYGMWNSWRVDGGGE